MSEYILVIDQGTTATKVVLYTPTGDMVGIHTKRIRQIYPHKGWVEHDPQDILRSIRDGISAVLQKTNVSPGDVIAAALDNQGETIIPFDRTTGKPIYNAIVWQDSRTSDFCRDSELKKSEEEITEKTGLFLDPYFSATKMRWVVDNVIESGSDEHITIATSDVWQLFMLTGGTSIYTDITTASRTMLFNINTLRWDEDILGVLKLKKSHLPDVAPSAFKFGITDPEICSGIRAPIYASVVDQQASLFGHRCVRRGEGKITYGTGGFLLINTGTERVPVQDRIITTVAAQHDGGIQYILEGGTYCVGSCVDWLMNNMRIEGGVDSLDWMVRQVADSGGVFFLPSMAGLSAPYWKKDVRGAFYGLTLDTSSKHLARAVLEGIAFRCYDIFQTIRKNSLMQVEKIFADGGVSKNNFLLQFQADLFSTDIIRPAIPEITSLGAAFLAGIQLGVWTSIEELAEHRREHTVFTPCRDNSRRLEEFKIWKKALVHAVDWAESQ